MQLNDIKYCLAKQIGSTQAVRTNYGDFLLDDETREALEKALRPILERRRRAYEFPHIPKAERTFGHGA